MVDRECKFRINRAVVNAVLRKVLVDGDPYASSQLVMFSVRKPDDPDALREYHKLIEKGYQFCVDSSNGEVYCVAPNGIEIGKKKR